MSRTFRTNKYGEVKTDKFKKGFNGCGCVYCEFKNKDFRNNHNEIYIKNEILHGKYYSGFEYWEEVKQEIKKL